MSLPSAARRPDDTVPSEPKTLVCPRCRATWPERDAPATCPADGAVPVRPREIASDDPDPMIGRTLEGRYTILAKLGAGSMGTVYRAKQHAMGREVAIKILRGDRAVDESAKARFMREARTNSLLASPNTVTVFDFGQSESGEFYLAMELLEGESLGQRIARMGRLPAPVAVDAARQALRSLGEAHAKGIIHRDLKPDNLFFARVLTSAGVAADADNPQGRPHEEIVKVLDFGIAKMLNAEEGLPMGVVETQAGTVFGTPRYMSPEQAQGKPLDPRTDLYSLGVILYQMLTGQPPFTDNDAVVVMARHIKSVPKRPNEASPEANVPKELEDVVMRALAKDPEARQPSAEIFAGELLAALEAQGAMSSGVRASITNAAGIRVPDSMRPPPVPLPKASGAGWLSRARWPLLAIVGPIVAVLVALGVYLGLSDRAPEPPTTEADPAVTQPGANAPVTATPPPSVESTAAPREEEDPSASASSEAEEPTETVTPDALPSASATATSTATARQKKRRPRPHNHAKAPETRSTATKTPAAAPSKAPTYGIFE